jgi:predicted nucleic acid-binding protein
VIVLDASAWVNVLTADLTIPQLGDADVYAPPHFDVEVVGSVRAMRQRDWITEDQANTAVDRHLRSVFWRTHDPADVRRAWSWRESLSFRDAWYVALARRLDAEWYTADERAAKTARQLGARVRTV